ncbi:unnamed protein product [Acanthoscelides obtectus]|uniref:Uncharacterized protein n=1 Tax=Acanthoscelides obtectus TaxID=200917 RepID=A0A9P0K1R9_ACAOB|nr:unnamed protein product [Acanthoscelides obtectus]CAK1649074.1 hypothetical protein AOBTE_LOCUS16021 [Acanthoscelides obtectus]
MIWNYIPHVVFLGLSVGVNNLRTLFAVKLILTNFVRLLLSKNSATEVSLKPYVTLECFRFCNSVTDLIILRIYKGCRLLLFIRQ